MRRSSSYPATTVRPRGATLWSISDRYWAPITIGMITWV